ncbi:phosphoenolpyruvate carboxykinase (GTP) [bacterium]|nr:phosphoenolpyruvate carboxykinase (GTP) [bacterium]
MVQAGLDFLKKKMEEKQYEKLTAIKNDSLYAFVSEFVRICEPDRITVITDSQEDLAEIRRGALERGEEQALAISGHTIHFDGYRDQARDKENTRILLSVNIPLGSDINTMDKAEGVRDVRAILQGIMKGQTLIVRFFCLGPTQSPFSILGCQLTDSYYVAHSLDLLYRQGYEEFRRQGEGARFFRIVHSQGELENGVSKNVDRRRVYIDCEDELVYSANTQYGGNTLGLKKLSMRLAIHRASKEGWLCEHMFVMGVHGPKGRVTYFTGAFPSLCGKTSTSMMTGEKIVGDDIAYLRTIGGVMRAVNVEKGMFGIIMGINSKDDPLIWKTLHSPNEIIFSNVLVAPDRSVYWIGKDGEPPARGVNHSGEWTPGKKDAKGKAIDPSHKNARFTIDLKCLENVDPVLDSPQGVEVGGIIYGGRDSAAWPPVRQSFDWVHGIATIASALESETTAATLGKEGVPEFNPMSNMDFLGIPLSLYIRNNLDFGKQCGKPPVIFGVNYFLKDREGRFLNDKTDKGVWLKWMELRVHGDVKAIRTPVGNIPRYEDLKQIFYSLQKKTFTLEQYNQMFSLRTEAFLSKLSRILGIYEKDVADAPSELLNVLREEMERIKAARHKFGPLIAPEQFL